VIGYALGLPVTERLEGTLVTTVLAAQAGYSFVRVHDVKENKRVLEMLNKVTNTQGKN
jgi:dihydropteroate synthase